MENLYEKNKNKDTYIIMTLNEAALKDEYYVMFINEINMLNNKSSDLRIYIMCRKSRIQDAMEHVAYLEAGGVIGGEDDPWPFPTFLPCTPSGEKSTEDRDIAIERAYKYIDLETNLLNLDCNQFDETNKLIEYNSNMASLCFNDVREKIACENS